MLVGVELEDLKKVVFATGALKDVERAARQITGALEARARDPFAKAEGPFTEAHDRLAAVMRNAERANSGTAVNWDGKLDEEEIERLYWVKTQGDKSGRMLVRISQIEKPSFANLEAKGCIHIGQLVFGAVWPGASQAEITADPAGYAVKITPRGVQKLYDFIQERGEKITEAIEGQKSIPDQRSDG
jgi:hypothetical protein